MKVLFIGGTGNISSYVSKLAIEMGIEVYLLTRGQNSIFMPKGAKSLVADIRNRAEVDAALDGMTFDVVADFITYLPDDLERNLDIFRHRCQQYIYISSSSVYTPGLLDLKDDGTNLTNLAWDYPRNKIACEKLLEIDRLLYGTNYTIVRPGETNGDLRISGVFVPHPQYWSIIERMRQGKKIIINDDGMAVRQYTHSSDFAKGFVGLFLNELAFNETFNITSDEVLSWNTVTEMVADAAGLKANILYIPSIEIVRSMPKMKYGSGDHGASTFGTMLCSKAQDKTVDNSKIKNLVPDFSCEVSFYEGTCRTLDFYENHPEFKQINTIWNQQMDDLVARYDNHQIC